MHFKVTCCSVYVLLFPCSSKCNFLFFLFESLKFGLFSEMSFFVLAIIKCKFRWLHVTIQNNAKQMNDCALIHFRKLDTGTHQFTYVVNSQTKKCTLAKNLYFSCIQTHNVIRQSYPARSRVRLFDCAQLLSEIQCCRPAAGAALSRFSFSFPLSFDILVGLYKFSCFYIRKCIIFFLFFLLLHSQAILGQRRHLYSRPSLQQAYKKELSNKNILFKIQRI